MKSLNLEDTGLNDTNNNIDSEDCGADLESLPRPDRPQEEEKDFNIQTVTGCDTRGLGYAAELRSVIPDHATLEVQRTVDSDRLSNTIQACQVVVDGSKTIPQLLARGFTKPKRSVCLLPYHEKMNKWIDEQLAHFELGISAAVLVNEPRPGLYNYLWYMNSFVERFGQRFVKEHHIRLIKLVHLIFISEGQWYECVHMAAQLLESLISGSRLNRKDLQLEWKPIFKLYYAAKYGKEENVKPEKISGAVTKLKEFYSLESGPEIWEQLQEDISSRYSNNRFCNLCNHFIAVDMSGEDHRTYGAGLWWDTLWSMYTMVEMGNLWGNDLLFLFSTVCYYAPEFMDWSTLYEDIFIRVLRGMGLRIRSGKILVGGGSDSTSINAFAGWIGDCLGGPKSCQMNLDRLLKCLDSFLHPANGGDHADVIRMFMSLLCDRVLSRVYRERIKKHKREVPVEYYLSDKDISKFVECMLQPTLLGLYSSNDANNYSRQIMVNLASLKPGLVIPKLLEHIYPALNAVCEPHRLTQTLEFLLDIIYQIAADQKPDRQKLPMKGDWVEEMEKVLSLQASHRAFNSSEKERLVLIESKRTLRHHLIYLLEALTVAIDINDFWKATMSLQNIILIFNLVPIVDSSPCIELRDDLTEDEIELCRLTARLPALANDIVEKLLHLIQSFSVCAPKNSKDLLGGLNDDVTAVGAEEQLLKTFVGRALAIILAHSSALVAKVLVDKIFRFVSTNQFESTFATEMTRDVLAEAVYACPGSWSMFAKFILQNLKSELTPEARRQKELDSITLWFVSLTPGLFLTTSESFVRNKTTCFEIIALLFDCEAKKAHEAADLALYYSFYMLSRTYIMNQHTVRENLSQTLTNWVPIREWALSYQEHEVSMAWHVPDQSRKEVIVEMLNRFAFPLMDRLQDETLDRFNLRKYLNTLHYAYLGAVNCFELPKSAHSAPVNPGITVLPFARRGPSNLPNVMWNITCPDGSNIREKLVDILEKIIDRLTASKDDTRSLSTVANFLGSIMDSKTADQGTLNSAHSHYREIISFLKDPKHYLKRLNCSSRDSLISLHHLDFVYREQPVQYSDFHHRIMSNLVRLAVNDYPEVRATAKSQLTSMLVDHPQSRDPMNESVVAILMDTSSSEENLKGALDFIHYSEGATLCNLKTRLQLWKTLVTMPMMELPIFAEYFNAIRGQVGKMYTPERKYKPDPVLEEFAADYMKDCLSKLPTPGVWAAYDTKEKLEATFKICTDLQSEKKKDEEILIANLLELFADRSLHHTRSQMCRTMIFRCQLQKANAATIKILLERMIDEVEYLRDRSAIELSYWMKMNKPKTITIEWTCPEKPANVTSMLCGLRPDNLIMAYDSENLPDTEEKWNKMLFFSKQYGCYKWPTTVRVTAPASGPLLERGPLSAAEKEIVAWFEEKTNLDRWVALLLIVKRESININDSTCSMIKYVLRNFPDNEKIYNNIIEQTKILMESRDRAGQRLAAEFFMGVAKGTRFRSFKVLDAQWKWLAPAVDKMFDNLDKEAETAWANAIPKILTSDDSRRFFWLIEVLLVGMTRAAPTAWHQSVRAGLITAHLWRDVETRKRICEIAWGQLPTAIIGIHRQGVCTALKNIYKVMDTNQFNDLEPMPERFRLKDADYWLKRFEEKIDIKSFYTTPVTSRSDSHLSCFDVATANISSRSRCASEGDINKQRTSQIYLRTMLKLLIEYYDCSKTCLTPGIINLFPTLVNYAIENESEDQLICKDVDIKQSASKLVHDCMSSLLLVEKYADRFLSVIINSFDRADIWRVKVSVLKYLQVIVFSNMYVCERGNRPKDVVSLIMRAIADVQNEVRQEAARCLLTLIHCGYIQVDDKLVGEFMTLLAKPCHRHQHGAVLAFGAIVMAHPYSTPPSIVPVLAQLCRVSSKQADIQSAATSALRKYRRSHRDDWAETVRLLCPNLVCQIENATPPVYYA